MTTYISAMLNKSQDLKIQADILTESAAREFHRTGNISGPEVQRITELNRKSYVVLQAMGRAAY